MSKRHLPTTSLIKRPACYRGTAPEIAVRHWRKPKSRALRRARAETEQETIAIYDVIGVDPMTGGGVTAKAVTAALASAGGKPLNVVINSPGGDMFEGLAIYNALREYDGEVNVKIMGLAASAASLLAMAGDHITMGAGSVMMIHNSWGLVMGNRHDFTEAAATFAVFDKSMAAIYAARTGMNAAAIAKLMDGGSKASDGTFMTSAEAVDRGFADETMDEEVDAEGEDLEDVDMEGEEYDEPPARRRNKRRAEDEELPPARRRNKRRAEDEEDPAMEGEEDPEFEGDEYDEPPARRRNKRRAEDIEEDPAMEGEDDPEMEDEEDPAMEGEDLEDPPARRRNKRRAASVGLDVRAKRQLEADLRAAGVSRSRRAAIVARTNKIQAARDAGRVGAREAAKRKAARDAGSVKALKSLLNTFRN